MKPRTFWHLGGPGPNVNIGGYGRDIATVTRGVLERVFLHNGVEPITPHYDTINVLLDKFSKRFNDLAPILTKTTPDEFIVGYSEKRKRDLYTRAKHVFQALGGAVGRNYSNVSTFVKFEKLNLTAKPDPAPRVIQPRNPVYNLALGLYIKLAEPKVCEVVAQIFGEPTISKGLNADACGRLVASKWSSFKNPMGVGLDASRFDQHVCSSMLRWEHRRYLRMFKNDPELARLLSMQLTNLGTAHCNDGKLKYKVDGCRMSGDMNTGIGNCLIMCAMVYSYLDHAKVHAKLINNGDDCMLFLEGEDLPKLHGLPAYFRELGFVMEVEEPVYVIEKVVFCQTQPVWVGGGYRMVRDPRIAMAKDRHIFKDQPLLLNRYRQSIGECGLSLAGDLPIYNEFYSNMITGARALAPETESGFQIMARGMDIKYSRPSTMTRYSFWLAFGFEPQDQMAWEMDIARTVYSNPSRDNQQHS